MELPASCAESPKDPSKDAALMHRQYAGVGFLVMLLSIMVATTD